MTLQQRISHALNLQLVGSVVEVLIDGPGEEGWTWYGRTAAHAPEVDGRVLISGGKAEAGYFIPVEITGATEYDIIGKIV
jgi:ribosomal protein S12 methylthiotransferase